MVGGEIAVGEGLAQGGKAVSWVLAVALVFRIFQWLCNFIGGRLDKRQAVLDAQQNLIDLKLVNRLKKLEVQTAVLERVTTILITEMREIDPGNRRLIEVHAILRSAIPTEENLPDDMQDAIDKLKGFN